MPITLALVMGGYALADRLHTSGPLAMVVAGLLIGMEVLVIPFTRALLIAGLLAIIITLFARWASVGGAVLLMRPLRSFSPGAIRILTWGGLRGGISVALALSIPAVPVRNTIVIITYLIVVFSIVVQGMSLGRQE